MINKEEIEKELKKWLSEEIVNTYAEEKGKKLNAILQYISKLEIENNAFKQTNVDNSNLISVIDIENYKLNKRIAELEQISEEHQKLNGELQKKLTEYEKQLDLDYVEENYVKKSVFLNLLKENGELKDRLIIAEEICKGKTIQEMGMSDLYEED